MNNFTVNFNNNSNSSHSFSHIQDPNGHINEFESVAPASGEGHKVEENESDTTSNDYNSYNDHFDNMEESLW